jgi:hypothetical protein
MSSGHIAAVRSNLQARLEGQGAEPEQEVITTASKKSEDSPLSHTDLRIVPEGWEPPKGSTNPLDHFDLRIVAVPENTSRVR